MVKSMVKSVVKCKFTARHGTLPCHLPHKLLYLTDHRHEAITMKMESKTMAITHGIALLYVRKWLPWLMTMVNGRKYSWLLAKT